MFKKLIAFTVWAFLLCILLIVCLVIATVIEWSLISGFILWLVLIIAIIGIRLAWVGIAGLSKAKFFGKLTARFKLSRMEHVLSEHWKTGVKVIKRIRYGKQPLPWFVLTGQRCGKTTLMASTGLPLFSNEPESGVVVPTRTLRWWFFRSAGFLDLSSQFLSKSPAFERAWLRLVSWCRRLPVPAGIVVCVSADDLQRKNIAELSLNARHIRTQIEPLIKKVKRRLPVYVVITCCDHLPGFTLWSDKLSPAQRQQALGYHWLQSPVVDSKDPAFLNPLFSTVKAGLDNVRISMFTGLPPDEDTLQLLDFPEQLGQLQPALQSYLAALCEPDAYFEPGALGGVWFTATVPISQNSAMRQAVFLHDLLVRQLPELSRLRQVDAIGFLRRFLQQWGVVIAASVTLALLLFYGMRTHSLTGGDFNTLTVAQQVKKLEQIESGQQQPLQYLPFIPALNYRHSQLEQRVLHTAPTPVVNAHVIAERYEQRFNQATPQQQRGYILDLAQSIMTKQAMLEYKPIAELHELPQIPTALSLVGNTTPVQQLHNSMAPNKVYGRGQIPRLLGKTSELSVLSHQHDIVLQRALLQQTGGVEHVQTMRQLLAKLVNSDSQWQWLLAADPELLPVKLIDFLPASDSQQQLAGQWTQPGTAQISHWLIKVRQAVGEDIKLAALDNFERQWGTLRQDQWMKLLLAMSQQQAPVLDAEQWQDTLIGIEQGNSPSMKFSRYIVQQLADVPNNAAAPWLRELRKLNLLQKTNEMAPLMQNKDRIELAISQKIASKFKLDQKTLATPLKDSNINAWNEWQSSLRTAVAEAVATPENSDNLTRGLFRSEEGSEGSSNPLQKLSGRFAALRKSINPAKDDVAVNAVWSLYMNDARLLTAHAMQRSSCWIQGQWQSRVLWPMEKNAAQLDYQDQQDMTWQYLSDFIRGPAKSVLVVGNNGPAAGEFDGQSLSLTPEFMRLVNHVLRPDDVLSMPERANTRSEDKLAKLQEAQATLEAELAAIEEQPVELMLTSQPATVPGGARLMPTGTQLTLFCDAQRWDLKSMNFSEQMLFQWQPGHCSRVTQTINFPGFDLSFDYIGDNAWPNFMRDIAEGKLSFSAEDFPEQSATLASLGIKEILVRYQFDKQNAVQATWLRWKAAADALSENAVAQQDTMDKKTEQTLPSALNGNISQLPAKIADCR
ncbi:type VI secretion protein IcmF/TssM N-terminal domain-containing protein [Yersinia enterocolitica]